MTAVPTLPLWPLSRAGDAIALLARTVGWSLPEKISLPSAPSNLRATARDGEPGSVISYLDAVASTLQLEVEHVLSKFGDLEELVWRAAPALILVRWPEEGMLALLRVSGRQLFVMAPDGSPREVAMADVIAALGEPHFAPLRPKVERLLDTAGVHAPRRRRHALKTILEDRLSSRPIYGGYLLRLSQSRPLRQHVKGSPLPRLLKWFGVIHFGQYLAGLLTVFLVGNGALKGRIDFGWLLAGALLLGISLPLQSVESWLLGRITIALGILLRHRLLWGALRLPLEVARRHGYGDIIGQIIESEGVEIGLRNGGLIAIGATLDILGALFVLLFSSRITALLLLLWIGLSVALALGYFRARRSWTDARFELTGNLLEKMLGHRTRLVQEPRAAWHRGEDLALVGYQARSRVLDRRNLALWSGVPFGWLVVGILSLTPVWLYAAPQAPQLALGLWGVLLGFRAFGRLSAGLTNLTGAAIALRRCRHLLESAAAPEPQSLTAAAPTFNHASAALQASGLSFRYTPTAAPVLKDLSLRVAVGDRVLIQGSSGSGKSTLLTNLAGLTPIDNGQLLLGGLDMPTLGERRWRRLVATAPQFHENHLFSATLAFNLLFGREWPPSAADLKEAEQLCHELGLGPLLERMPSGLHQMVGETGWQLSHGERSRVYIARTLLQHAAIILLDESFAALDPQALAQALRCVLRRAPTLLVIAHP